MLVHQLLILQKARLKKDFDEKKITVEKYVEKTSLMNMEIKISERKICDEFCLYQIKNIMLSTDSLDVTERLELKSERVYEYEGKKFIFRLSFPRTMNVFKNNEYILQPSTGSGYDKYEISIGGETYSHEIKIYKPFKHIEIERHVWQDLMHGELILHPGWTIDRIKKYCELICDKSGLKIREIYIDCNSGSVKEYSQPDGIPGTASHYEIANLNLYEIYTYCKFARNPDSLTTREKNFIATGKFKLESNGYVINPLTGDSEKV